MAQSFHFCSWRSPYSQQDILFFNILNCILLAVNNHIVPLLYFDVEAFQESEWYYWGLSSNFKLVYLAFGILGPLALKWAWDRLRASFGKRFLRNKSVIAE